MIVRALLCRYMKVEVRNLSYISNELDEGNVCPACPKVIAKYIAPVGRSHSCFAIEKWKCDDLYGCSVWTSTKKICWTKS